MAHASADLVGGLKHLQKFFKVILQKYMFCGPFTKYKCYVRLQFKLCCVIDNCYKCMNFLFYSKINLFAEPPANVFHFFLNFS